MVERNWPNRREGRKEGKEEDKSGYGWMREFGQKKEGNEKKVKIGKIKWGKLAKTTQIISNRGERMAPKLYWNLRGDSSIGPISGKCHHQQQIRLIQSQHFHWPHLNSSAAERTWTRREGKGDGVQHAADEWNGERVCP
jgi:hypothetical protein